jgi:hypothetical protein
MKRPSGELSEVSFYVALGAGVGGNPGLEMKEKPDSREFVPVVSPLDRLFIHMPLTESQREIYRTRMTLPLNPICATSLQEQAP